jgi:wobble nucleotide-excising tRNase
MSLEALLLLSIVSHNLKIIKAKSTSTSSFESGWPNVQADNALVSIEQYRSLQARFNEMQREHSNLVKQCDLLEAKNSALKYVLLHYKPGRLAYT